MWNHHVHPHAKLKTTPSRDCVCDARTNARTGVPPVPPGPHRPFASATVRVPSRWRELSGASGRWFHLFHVGTVGRAWIRVARRVDEVCPCCFRGSPQRMRFRFGFRTTKKLTRPQKALDWSLPIGGSHWRQRGSLADPRASPRPKLVGSSFGKGWSIGSSHVWWIFATSGACGVL